MRRFAMLKKDKETTTLPRLKSIAIKGFRSIRETKLELRPINVLVGANGAGKSNLIAFFKLLNELTAGRLQQHIAATGRAASNLHFGPKTTPQLEAEIEFETEKETETEKRTYRMRLFHAAGDSLIFAEETLSFQESDWPQPKIVPLGAGHQETRIGDKAAEDDFTAKNLLHLLNRCRVYHFHDTSPTAGVRQYCYVGDNRWIMPDAANLAAVLYALKSRGETAYRRIVATIRQAAPFFDDFDLEPVGPGGKEIILNWRHRNSGLIFGPHQFSDGTLRAVCLISLLLQPKENFPYLIALDEPELGLHPYALDVIASLFRAASRHAQILVGTQSGAFLDSFEPGDVVVVERNDEDEATEFDRPPAEKLSAWMADYSLGEIWEKNVIGGGPH